MYEFAFGITIYLAIVFILTFNAKSKAVGDEFLSRSESTCLKGISIITICIYHYLVNVDDPGVLFVFSSIGYLGVAIFFFLSGYGIAKTYQTNGLNNFIPKRIKKVYVPFVVVNSITIVLYRLSLKQRFTVINIIEYITGIKLIDDVLWYVIVILLFYLVFYLLYKHFSIKYATIFLFVLSVMYPIVCYVAGIGMRWFSTSLSFFIGVSIVFYKEKYDKLLKEKYLLFLTIFCTLFLIFTYGSYYFSNSNFLKIWLCYFSSISFNFIIIQLLYKIRLGNVFLTFIGGISYWLYLSHMKIYNIIFSGNNTLYCIIPYIIVLLAISYICNKTEIILTKKHN